MGRDFERDMDNIRVLYIFFGVIAVYITPTGISIRHSSPISSSAIFQARSYPTYADFTFLPTIFHVTSSIYLLVPNFPRSIFQCYAFVSMNHYFCHLCRRAPS